MPAPTKISIDDVLAAFHGPETLREVSQRFGISRVRLGALWKSHYGVSAFEERTCRAPSAHVQEEAHKAFSTSEPFKKVAQRLGMSPNTLRKVWVDKHGLEAFQARSKASHWHAGQRVGSAGASKKHTIRMTEALCEGCGKPVSLNLLQKARTEHVLCVSCKEAARGVALACPVCGFGCTGTPGLAHHMARPKNGDQPAHAAYVAGKRDKQEALRWEGLQENHDFVICRVCSVKGITLGNHIKLHGLTADDYFEKFPGAYLTPRNVESRRMHALQGYYEDISYGWSREDLLKFTDEKGQVIVAEAAMMLDASPGTVLQYCRKLNLPTRNRLAWQRTVLDLAAKALKAPFKEEWSDPRITNYETGRVFNYDGFFPKHNLIVEVHGDQHFRFSEAWHGSLEGFHESRERDKFKKEKAEELGYKFVVVRPTDPVGEPNFWLSLLGGKPSPVINIEPIVHDLMANGFPKIEPMVVELKKALTRLEKIEPYLDGEGMLHPYSTVGTTASGSFFPSRYHAKHKGSLSAWEAWHSNDAMRKAVQLQVDSGHPTTPLRVLRALVM